MSEYITVTQLNKTIKQLFDQTAFLKRLSVMGELSNFKRHSSGTYYFTLKDQGSEIKSVMFASAAVKLSHSFKDGDQVIASGDVNVYDVRGEYQLYVTAMRPTGAGDIYAKLEALKKKLLAEGLLDESHKKPLPKYPRVVGVITSPTGAAVQDIQNTIARRFPLAVVRIYPAQVQGEEAKYSVTKQIEKANLEKRADVLIVGRGGGSIEDLWAFNEELVLRAIFASQIPIISAVGHETDTTLSDLIADRRAPTPTAAAELAVPDKMELLQVITSQQTLLKTRIANVWQGLYRRYQRASSSYVLTQPERLLQSKQLTYERLVSRMQQQSPLAKTQRYEQQQLFTTERLQQAYRHVLTKVEHRLESMKRSLNALNPNAVLDRGFTLIETGESVITSVQQVKENDAVTIRFKDGSAESTITKTRRN